MIKEYYQIYQNTSGLLVAESAHRLKSFIGHVHTTESDGSITPEQAVERAVEAGVDTVAITDHNNVTGSLRGRDYAEKHALPIDVITGSEISTADGHVLAFGLTKDIQQQLSAAQTIGEIHEQEGVAVAAHPDVRHGISSFSQRTIRDLLKRSDTDERLDGVEVLNAGISAFHTIAPLICEDTNERTRVFQTQYKDTLAAFGGVDAHGKRLDQVVTGYREDDPLEAIRQRETIVFFDPAMKRKDRSREETLYMFAAATKVAKRRITGLVQSAVQ